MTHGQRFTFTGQVHGEGWGVVVTVPGHVRRRWLARVDFERALVLIGAFGILAAVAVALWGQV